MPNRSSINSTEVKVIVKHSIGQNEELEKRPQKNPAAVALGKLGGLKGGKARAAKLTAEKRSEIAKIAADARWRKRDK